MRLDYDESAQARHHKNLLSVQNHNKGDLPVMLARYMGKSLEQAIKDSGDRGSVDWTALNLEFDRLAQKTWMGYRKSMVF